MSMPPFDECCVLIPAPTLEDFPTGGSDSDARSLLAAWTFLWHPQLLVHTQQTPTWYRADAPPDPPGKRLITVPSASRLMLPDDYEERCERDSGTQLVFGGDRDDFLAAADLDQRLIERIDSDSGKRSIGVDDFYALAYTALQIQVMTRRLRYTSNLDEIQLQGYAVEAAGAFLNGDANSAVESMHAAFDALAEERDHYFPSDPALIDLILATPTTTKRLIDSASLRDQAACFDKHRDSATVISTPVNLLLDHPTARALADQDPSASDRSIAALLRTGHLGWAGGGPGPAVCFDLQSYDQAERSIDVAFQETTESIGQAPKVFARFSGHLPSDLLPCVKSLGAQGLIPIDFASGTGHGEESKVICQSGTTELEALTAKPIDAASDAAFLNLAARLGESIDSGEVATALLAHWPDNVCDAFRDLRQAASWTLALGKFWRLDDYFQEGESPYHQGNLPSTSVAAAEVLVESVNARRPDPLNAPVATCRRQLAWQRERTLAAMQSLASGQAERSDPKPSLSAATESPPPSAETPSVVQGMAALADALKMQPQATADAPPHSVLVLNPDAAAIRTDVTLLGHAPKAEVNRANEGTLPSPLYDASTSNDSSLGPTTVLTVDTPGFGFCQATASSREHRQRGSWKRWFHRPSTMARDNSLVNQFLEATIGRQSGGIDGVFSGSERGNRFSMRLVSVTPDDPKGLASTMHCDSQQVVESTEHVGVIETTGRVMRSKVCHATFRLTYTLRRGSRWIEVGCHVEPNLELVENPWLSYIAARVAVASESALDKVIVRDKLHRANGKRITSATGVLVDEVERKTLILCDSSAFHRRVTDRFLDTLLCVRGQQDTDAMLGYGFDVPATVATAKSRALTPCIQSIAAQPSAETGDGIKQAWLVHVSPRTVLLDDFSVDATTEGSFDLTMRLIQTEREACKVKIRFCRSIRSAHVVPPLSESMQTDSPEKPDADSAQETNSITVNDDELTLSVQSHQVERLRVRF
ncbi:MAG: hypothetical protein AAGA03_13880 [Planctomycetota bacterium]